MEVTATIGPVQHLAGLQGQGEDANMPALTPYAAILDKWSAALGHDRPPLAIATADIDAVIAHWSTILAPDTVHKRRGVLFTFYRTMYPEHVNPVAAATNPTPPEPVMVPCYKIAWTPQRHRMGSCSTCSWRGLTKA